MGAIAPTAKKLWGRCPQVAPTGILLCRRCSQPKGTVKLRMGHYDSEKGAPILARKFTENIWRAEDPLGELTALSEAS